MKQRSLFTCYATADARSGNHVLWQPHVPRPSSRTHPSYDIQPERWLCGGESTAQTYLFFIIFQTGCTIMAALLHYFLLALFCWMLCEGVLLYILLVKVFGGGADDKVKYFYLLGWGKSVCCLPIFSFIFIKVCITSFFVSCRQLSLDFEPVRGTTKALRFPAL